MAERRRVERKKGRAEQALEHALIGRQDIGLAERSALRVQAHALDLAEAARDPDLITTANDGYLRLRASAGLTSAGAKPVDAFDELLAQLAAPDAGHPAQP